MEENYQRTYPNKTAACQLIGYTSSGNVGNWGIEQQYNDVLNGNEGRKYSYMNSDGEIESEVHDAMDGNSVVSTIDLNIQNIVDKEIATFMKSVGAKNVSALVMNPNNSEKSFWYTIIRRACPTEAQACFLARSAGRSFIPRA